MQFPKNREKFKKRLILFFFPSLSTTLIIASVLILVITITGLFQNFIVLGNAQAQIYQKQFKGFGTLCIEVKKDRQIYEEEINKYEDLKKYNLWILAQVCQESQGLGNDPMQASESKCGEIGCIQEKKESIEYGIKHLNSLLQKVKSQGLEENFETVLQVYNFGPAYIDFLKSKEASFTTESLAEEFSILKCGTAGTNIESAVNENKEACYGDYLYVEHVKRYLEFGGSVNEVLGTLYGGKKVFLTQMYGMTSYASGGAYGGSIHNGIDLDGGFNSEIFSVAKGKVFKVVLSEEGYGHHIVVQYGGVFWLYGHLDQILVYENQEIDETTIIGTQGNTGNSFGSHLHLSIFTESDLNYNSTIDPSSYIKDEITIIPSAY